MPPKRKTRAAAAKAEGMDLNFYHGFVRLLLIFSQEKNEIDNVITISDDDGGKLVYHTLETRISSRS